MARSKKDLVISECVVYSPVGFGDLMKINVKYEGNSKWELLRTFLANEIKIEPKELLNMKRDDAIEYVRKKIEKYWKKKEISALKTSLLVKG